MWDIIIMFWFAFVYMTKKINNKKELENIIHF